jgi:hypothetical protein
MPAALTEFGGRTVFGNATGAGKVFVQMASPGSALEISEKDLTRKVRKALGSPEFRLTEWRSTTLTGHISNPATSGLYRVAGSGLDRGGSTDWSFIVKVAHLTDDAPEGWGTDLLHFGYWKREALAYRSGVLDSLMPDLRAPHCFEVEEQPDGSLWLWLEEVQECTDPAWPVTRYALAARHFGEWQGAYLAGRPLPDEVWLKPGWLRSWIDHFAFLSDYLGRAEFWEHPLVRSTFPDGARERLLRFWCDRDTWLEALDTLPTTVCHFDLWRPNLFAGRGADGREQTVALDWQCVALGPAGEVGNLVVTSLMNLEVDVEEARTLDSAVWQGYLKGMRAAGWDGDERAVRFAYAAYPALRWGAVFPMLMILPCVMKQSRRDEAEAKHGLPIEEIMRRWAGALGYVLDLADEARLLADCLPVSPPCRPVVTARI